MPKTFRLTETHPIHKKIDALYDYMRELGIVLSCNSNGMSAIDEESGVEYHIKDTDSGLGVETFPTGFEFKITYEKDEE